MNVAFVSPLIVNVAAVERVGEPGAPERPGVVGEVLSTVHVVVSAGPVFPAWSVCLTAKV